MTITSSPLVSVNITTFNRCDLLPRCINSILIQSFADFEIIVVDDSSNDQTSDVVLNLMKNDSRIKFIRHSSNLGNAAARNTALKYSRGKYIALMDDDDEWLDHYKLEKQVSIFLSSSSNKYLGVVCSSVRIFTAPHAFYEKKIEKPADIRSQILSGNGFIYNSSVLISHSMLAQAGGFDEKIPKGIDSELYRRLILLYDCDVHIMSEITTAVHEYGEDRMTSLTSFANKVKSIKSHIFNLKKFFVYFIVRPKLFFLRLKSILILIILVFSQSLKILFAKSQSRLAKLIN